MGNVTYSFTREIPVVSDSDVVVVGGGPGGLGAAVMAARAGARVLLVERYGFLGGMASAGEINPFMPNHARGASLDRPVYLEWAERIHSYLPRDVAASLGCPDRPDAGRARILSKDAAMLAAEDLCLEAGVRLLYHHWLADAVVQDRTIRHAVLVSKSGFCAVRGACFVDCTGDGDLAVLSGCRYEQGGPSGFSQPMTLCFKLSHVDRDRMPPREEMTRRYHEARRAGQVECPREDVLHFGFYDEDVVHFNTTRVIRRNGACGTDLSEAEIEGRRQLRQFLTFFRTSVPGFENARLHSVAHHIGVRETRRIRGLRVLGRDSFDRAEKFADGIARVHYPIDIHNPDGTGTEHARLPPDEYYEVPYGCVVAADIDNLTIGGRPVSADHAVHSSLRVMPCACSIGQAAGLAAATAAARGCRPADLGGREIRQLLRTHGAAL